MKKIGVKDIRLDIDYNYPNVKNSVLPKLFEFTKQKSAQIGLNLTLTEMTLSTFNSNN